MGTASTLRIVFVEDVPTDTELARRALGKAGIDFVSVRVATRAAFLEALTGADPDIVISDYVMPSFDGISALKLARERDPFLPFIVLTGSLNEDTAVACIKAGANDYVIKERMTRLPFAVKEALALREFRRGAAESDRRFRESEERYRSIFVNSTAVMLIIDPEYSVILDANNAAVAFYGWPREELIGKPVSEINTLSPELLGERMRDALRLKKNHFQFRHRLANGTVTDVETHSGPISLGGKTYLFSIIHDISERIAAEGERDALTTRLAHYLATSPTITYSFGIAGGRAIWRWVSENVERILGYSPAEALEPDWWFSHVHPEDRKEVIRILPELVREDVLTREYRFATKDRRSIWLRDELRIMRNEDGSAEVVGTLTDVSRNRKAEEELVLKSAALDAAANAVIITDREGCILWLNPAFERLTGYARAEVLGRNPRELVKSGMQDEKFYRAMWETITAGMVWNGKIINRRKSGQTYAEDMTITPVSDKDGRILNYVAIKNDVTERELGRQRLEALNRGKDALLREVHHRVNNNMQVIISLLRLSSPDSDDQSVKDTWGGIGRRIQSMALIHAQFYESDDLANIEFSISLRRIVDGIRVEHPETASRITVAYETVETFLDLEKAIPAGLVFAELVSNAFVHAFPDGSKTGNILITQRAVDTGMLEIGVRDDGIGMPRDFDPPSCGSLGMILIEGFSKQLRGEVVFSGEQGTTAILRFPAGSRDAESAPTDRLTREE
ncbi:MAG: PAS domain S-box protein [Spirochaetes bacterium]|nr:PAS domain S-box protein [Spirochaetota bacterium]